MPEIEGLLIEVKAIEGIGKLKDLRIIVGGVDFYKTVWELDEKARMEYKPTSIMDELNHSEEFPKEEFIRKLEENRGNKLRVEFEKVNTNFFSYLLDRFNGLKIPKRHNEIKSIEYLR